MAKKPVDPIIKLTEAVEKLTKEVGDLKNDVLKRHKWADDNFKKIWDYAKSIKKDFEEVCEIVPSLEWVDGEIDRLDDRINKLTSSTNEWVAKERDRLDDRINKLTSSTNEWVEEERDRLDDRIDKLEEKIEEQESDSSCNIENLRHNIECAVDEVAESVESSMKKISKNLNSNARIANGYLDMINRNLNH